MLSQAGLGNELGSMGFVLGLVFALATPLGVAAGVLLDLASGVEGGLTAYFVALAGGSFCFVALIEVLPRELANRRVGKAKQLLALGVGFGAMAGLAGVV